MQFAVVVLTQLGLTGESLPARFAPERVSRPLCCVFRFNMPELAFGKLAFALLREGFACRDIQVLDQLPQLRLEGLPVEFSHKFPLLFLIERLKSRMAENAVVYSTLPDEELET